jgi:hypothetical protein
MHGPGDAGCIVMRAECPNFVVIWSPTAGTLGAVHGMSFVPSLDAAAGVAVWVAIALAYVAAVVGLVRQGRAPHATSRSILARLVGTRPDVAVSVVRSATRSPAPVRVGGGA